MIKYALACSLDHEFEAWFSSSEDFDQQAKTGLVICPVCGDTKIHKQIMAPAVRGGKGRNQAETQTFATYAKQVREHIEKSHEYVGDDFANRARAMHDGMEEQAPIYGQVSQNEAQKLAEDGVPAVPLPEPFVPTKAKKLN